MANLLKLYLLFCLLGLFISCGSKKSHFAESGKYGTIRPGSQTRLAKSSKYIRYALAIKNSKLLEFKYKMDFKDMVLYLLYLREDSTFVMSTCNNQVRIAGKYITKPDSVILYSIYDFSLKQNLPNKHLFYDRKTNNIFFTTSNITEPPTRNQNKYKFKERVSVLNSKFEGHSGFMRNEDWPLDSLLKNYYYYDKSKQFQWMDSVTKIR